MVADFRQRFWFSLVVTVPIVALSPMLQDMTGLRDTLRFAGDGVVLWSLSNVIFFYGGWPFLIGLYREVTNRGVTNRKPGMMTLVAVATATAYIYSSAVVFGLAGKDFFWELASLIDIMLLGHWIEMKSVMGASRALEKMGSRNNSSVKSEWPF